MPDRARVLLFEPSRYRALLISRMLSREFESAVVARFEHSFSAIRELSSIHYRIAIVNIESFGDRPIANLRNLLKVNPQLGLIALGSPETPKAVVSAVSGIAQEYLVWQGTADQAPLEAITQAIENIVQSDYRPESAGQFVAEQAVTC